MTFKLYSGKFIIPGRNGAATVTLRPGATIQTATDLEARFPELFRRLPDDATVTHPNVTANGEHKPALPVMLPDGNVLGPVPLGAAETPAQARTMGVEPPEWEAPAAASAPAQPTPPPAESSPKEGGRPCTARVSKSGRAHR